MAAFWVFYVSVMLDIASSFCQQVPQPMPAVLTLEKSFWSFFSTINMYRLKFNMRKGKCQAEQQYCLGQELTAVECAAECEKERTCVAFDRPNVFGKAPCCLSPGSQAVTADGSPGSKCFERDTTEDFYFGHIWRQPSLYSVSHLSTREDQRSGRAVMDLCLPWSHCSFRIFNCAGEPLYALEAKMLSSVSNPLQQVWSYEIRNSSGGYLGRTSELQSGYEPIDLFDAHGRVVATLSTTWSLWSAMSSGNWYINNQFPGIPLSQAPVLDGRLVTFLTAYQFAAQGWFGPFWTCLWCCAFFALCMALKRLLQARRTYDAVDQEACWGSPKENRELMEKERRGCRAC